MTSKEEKTFYPVLASLNVNFLRKYEKIGQCIIFTTVSVDLLSFSSNCVVAVQFNQT